MTRNPVYSIAVFFLALATILTGIGTITSILVRDIFWLDAFKHLEDIGNNCAYTISVNKIIPSDFYSDWDMKQIRVPFRRGQKFPIPQRSEYLITKCTISSKSFTSRTAWVYLGPVYGKNEIFVNNRLVLESLTMSIAEFSITTEDILNEQVNIFVISEGTDTGTMVGLTTLIPAVLTMDKNKVEQLRRSMFAWDGELQTFGLAFCFGFAIIFGIAWAYGMRYSDIGWVIIMNCVMTAIFLIRYTPLVGNYLSSPQLAEAWLNMAMVGAYACFVASFFRTFRTSSLGWIYLCLITVYAVALFMVNPAQFSEYKMQARVPLSLGIVSLFSLGIYGARDLLILRKVNERKVRRWTLTSFSFFIAIVFAMQIALEQVHGVQLSNYIFVGVILVFAGMTAYDMVVYRNRLLKLEIESRTNKAIAQTAHMLSHDIQRPIKLITSAIEALETASNPEMFKQRIEGMLPGLETSISDIRMMLDDVNEIGSSRLAYPTPLRLASLLTECKHLFAYQRDEGCDDILISCPDHAGILGDAIKIKRLFTNLISNAIDARSPGTPVEILIKRQGTFWNCSVSNYGPSIAEEMRDRIFEAFFTSGKVNGTGLGLAIVRKVAREHGSEVKVESKSNGQTTFSLNFKAVELTSIIDSPPSKKRHCLLVDDDPFASEIWKETLKRFQITVISNPDLLLEQSTRNPDFLQQFSFAIIDFYFDDSSLNGVDVANFLAAKQLTLPIIISSYNPDAVGDNLPAQVISVINKEPRTWNEIKELIDRAS